MKNEQKQNQISFVTSKRIEQEPTQRTNINYLTERRMCVMFSVDDYFSIAHST